MFGRKKRHDSESDDSNSDDHTLTNDPPPKSVIKRATRTRKTWSWISSFLLFVSVVFLILVLIGNTSINPILNDIYFINLNLRNIVPTTIPNAVLINSIAQTLGLHDFYRVGLWNFCEGNQGPGVTYCSDPETLWWFNPVAILQSELLAGATIALPSDINDILNLIHLASNVMFGFFLAGVCLSFVMMFIVPLSVYTRWATFPIMLLTFIAALFTTVATVLATVLFIIMQEAVTSVSQLNIDANVGIKMFAFMWTATACAIVAWLVQLSLCCCCASRRDVRTGRKRGSKKAWSMSEKPRNRQSA